MRATRGSCFLLAVGLFVGSTWARVPYPVDSLYADSVRIAVLSNDVAAGFCPNMPMVGPQTRDFVVAALDTAHCRNVKVADAPSATMDTILAMFSGKLPHVIVHVNAGWGYAPLFADILSWAAQYNVGIVEVGDDDAVYMTRVFPWASYQSPYNWSPMLTGTWLKDTLDTLSLRLQPGMDVSLDSTAYPHLTGLVRNTVSILRDSTLYFKPYTGEADGRCESDPDIYAVDSVSASHMLNLGYQQGYNAVCDTLVTEPTCSTIVGLPGEFNALRVLQDSIPIGTPLGLRRAVVLSFAPQFFKDSVAAQQIVYDAVMYGSIVHMSNPPAPEVSVGVKHTRPATLSGALSLTGMRGAKIRVTDMSGRAVYEGIMGSPTQVRKVIGALPIGVYLAKATRGGMVSSFPFVVAR